MRFSHATPEATYGFAKRFAHYKDFYARHDGLIFSKLGFGTFKKEPYKEENYTFDYKDALKTAIHHGVNVIDTAINYRYQQSEREIGEVLEELFKNGDVKREELIICSKGGFVPLDFPFPENPYEWINEHIIQKGLATSSDIELDQHCMTPAFLNNSLERSLANLHVKCLDIYFLHNPETQLTKIGYNHFLKQLEEIFESFEAHVREGKIKAYGIAVWNAFTYEEGNSEYINLEEVYDVARKVGGASHHFKYIQLPFNIAKTNAYSVLNQKMSDGKYYTPLQVAHKLGLGVMSSSSLLQMHLFQKPFKPEVGYLLDSHMELQSDIQLALQFVRSTRGIVTSLFSSSKREHVSSNLEIATINATNTTKYNLLYKVER
ncbi:aldo/keto reductase [Sulfurospirillum diekertiae]|uniref:Aldo/keto reductase n=1 Tax=Sulfurospirillum diekertiae TaxID=1854492 RepID=A0A6G9VXJ9_9BACT|nr:aldo/keto reductase [Sulfurospirillum diekertiae]QIR77070.1 aldo/keto reductase [Sulfurospirillum diekertiae]QIR79684.1 aldo/keto reductase [Sulfurospirillum diekertiae]